jgi:phage terminase large subunit-like protein
MSALPELSLIDELAALPAERRAAALAEIPDELAAQALYDWSLWARPDQREPQGRWRVWLMRSGRGAGKTRAGAEWVRAKAEGGTYGRFNLVGRTMDDLRNTAIEGPSGILSVSHPALRPRYQPRRRRLLWPNGALALLFSAEEPDTLRGPQCEAAWCEEVASWRYPEAFDNLMLGLRLGSDPRCVITSTPRPTKLLRNLVAAASTVQTVSSTYINRTNLAPQFFSDTVSSYEGTRLGRQELYGEILEDVPGALWNHELLDELRVKAPPADARGKPLPWKRVLVAVDPAVSSGEAADETGIVVVAQGEDEHAYLLADRSGRHAPIEWGRLVSELYHAHEADKVVAEANQGGDLVTSLLRTVDPYLPVKLVRASRGKYVRAEPVAVLYEQGRVHHLGCFSELEDQMCCFVPDIDRARQGSPDRVDALVWGLTELLVKHRDPGVIRVG